MTLDYREAAVVVDVSDMAGAIPAAGPAPDVSMAGGAGMGLLGLRERLSLYGGEFDAGPRPAGAGG